MEILILSSTIITSIITKKIHKLCFINDLAKKNYKLDNYHYDKSIIYIIPIINIGYLIARIKKYNISNIEYLKNNSIVIPLTKKEKNIYKEYSNVTTALNINQNKKYNTNMIVMDLEHDTANTLYITNEGRNYHINYSEGPVSKLPKKEQYDFLMRELEEIESKPKVKIKK